MLPANKRAVRPYFNKLAGKVASNAAAAEKRDKRPPTDLQFYNDVARDMSSAHAILCANDARNDRYVDSVRACRCELTDSFYCRFLSTAACVVVVVVVVGSAIF